MPGKTGKPGRPGKKAVHATTVLSMTSIHQLKVTLVHVPLPVWRRVLVPGRFSLLLLHDVIQRAMGWSDSHLHQFIADGRRYGIPDPEDREPVEDERRVRVGAFAAPEGRGFVYQYDFGDNWEHDVVVEKIVPPEEGAKYPRCTGGAGACPPEDIGGIGAYEDFLAAVRDPKHEEHDTFMEWVGGEFDPEVFDLDKVNRELRRLK
jgi:hypothetical protein